MTEMVFEPSLSENVNQEPTSQNNSPAREEIENGNVNGKPRVKVCYASNKLNVWLWEELSTATCKSYQADQDTRGPWHPSLPGEGGCPLLSAKYRVTLKGLQGFEISCYSAAKGEKPAPICLSAIFGQIDEKSRNPVQAFQSNAVHTSVSVSSLEPHCPLLPPESLFFVSYSSRNFCIHKSNK